MNDLRFVIADPLVSQPDAIARRGKRFTDLYEHDNFITQAMMKCILENMEGILCTGLMGEVSMPHADLKYIYHTKCSCPWIVSSLPVHPSILKNKMVNLHGGPECVECEDCTDGNNITIKKDYRFINISLEKTDYKIQSLEDIYQSLPERYKC